MPTQCILIDFWCYIVDSWLIGISIWYSIKIEPCGEWIQYCFILCPLTKWMNLNLNIQSSYRYRLILTHVSLSEKKLYSGEKASFCNIPQWTSQAYLCHMTILTKLLLHTEYPYDLKIHKINFFDKLNKTANRMPRSSIVQFNQNIV